MSKHITPGLHHFFVGPHTVGRMMSQSPNLLTTLYGYPYITQSSAVTVTRFISLQQLLLLRMQHKGNLRHFLCFHGFNPRHHFEGELEFLIPQLALLGFTDIAFMSDTNEYSLIARHCICWRDDIQHTFWYAY